LKLFSWQAFLVDAGKYSDWIDRGRPAPRHGDVGEYLRWVSSKAGLEVKIADIDKLGFDSGRWAVSCKTMPGMPFRVNADGIVFTGPGPAKQVNGQVSHPRVTTGENFWSRLHETLKQLSSGSNVCVIGTG